MTPLRQRMIREMQLRQFSPRTMDVYVAAVLGLATFYRRSPQQLSQEEVRSYLHHLLVDRRLAQATCHLQAAAITFLYRQVLGQKAFEAGMRCKHSGKLPEVYSREELVRLFEAASNQRNRVLLMTAYAAGLRLSEVRHLKPIHIHAQRMLIRVEQGKGQKDRYTLLSPCSPTVWGPVRWPAARPSTSSTPPSVGPACSAGVASTPCVTASPPISSKPAWICAPSRSSWGTKVSTPPPCICTSPKRN